VTSPVISLAAAQQALAAGARAAEEMGVVVSLAIVDAGGILRAFARMDGAEIAGEVLAVDKVFTAVSHRTATADLAKLADSGGELFGLYANGRGRYVLFGGGLPIAAAGEVIGGIGVSGAPAAQDVRCAEAVLAALDLGA
jgi:uncharacterized protein GlcG (DUF336 family)